MSLVAGSPARSVNELGARAAPPPPPPAEVAEALALVHRPAAPGDRPERLAGDRVVAADLDADRAGAAAAAAPAAESAAVLENPLGLPGGQLADLLGKRLRVARELERLDGQDRRRRVVAVAAPLGREPGDDHVGPERADHPHDVGHDGLPIPDPERLGGVLREAEVDGAGEELPAAVEAAGGEQLLGADHPQLLEELGADHVLAAVAPREREIGRAVAAAAREVGDELGVLVVGVRGHVQDAPQLAEPAQLPQGVLGRHRLRGAAAGDRPGQQGPGQDEVERAKRRAGATRGSVVVRTWAGPGVGKSIAAELRGPRWK